MNPTTCPHCSADLPPGQIVTLCPKCGKEVRAAADSGARPAERSCPKCNYLLQPFEDVCPRCGGKPAQAAGAGGPFRPVAPEADAEKTAPIGPPQTAPPPGPPPLSAQKPPDDLRPVGGPPPPSAQKPSDDLRPVGGPPPPSAQKPSGDLRPMGGPAGPAPAQRTAAPDLPWGPTPATGHGRPGSAENTSGTRGAVPAEVMGWNWGAFFLNWIWGIAHNVWIALLAIPLGLIMSIVLGIKGSEWAWQNRRFASVAEFKQVQRVWGWVGFALFMLQVLFAVAWVGLAIYAAVGSSSNVPSRFGP